jgi:hypothetical protein
MKAVIQISTADSEFSQDQTAIMKRVALVLIEHDLSVVISIKTRRTKPQNIKLRVV